MNARIFGREPALILALVAAVVQGASLFLFDLSSGQQGVLNGLAVAVVGLVVAHQVAKEKVVPALLGVVQAVVSLGLAFGLDLSAEQQTVIMSLAAAAVGMFTRTQVEAKVSADA